jgi:hypothetical protein
MNGSDGERIPKPGKVISLRDVKKEKEARARTLFYSEHPDSVDYSKLGDPERKHRDALDALAVEAVQTLRSDPRCSVENIAGEIANSKNDKETPASILVGTTHGTWLQNPARYYAAADQYLHEIDKIAEEIAQHDLHSSPPEIALARRPELYTQARSEFLIELIRNSRQDAQTFSYITDVALEYRKRRMNGTL